MTLPDYHLHTRLCRHAEGEPRDYADCAVRVGLREIGFSDHAPMPRDNYDNWRMNQNQLDEYVEWVRRAQRDYPQLTIRLGLELDYLPGLESWIAELAGRYPWDYLIGSVHYVRAGWDVDNPEKRAQWDREEPREVWAAYFERLTQAAETRMFDIIGHADLPKKFGHFLKQGDEEIYRPFLRAARRSGVAIELNTGGLRKECAEIYPGKRFLALAWSERIPITFGSDAHLPTEVGLGFSEAHRLARACGYTQFCRWAGRAALPESLSPTE
ncbi:MAG TPA: histidinol-phosphatase HisJ family protein [Candidatus Paceibacterota bacterium]|nr:histidinol-phosphatase HisJ family protein [Verrucomicrobiota bacterium]HRY51016.1 histidinol-phosphatase HisJ family protein [Candidatus Paceibacterota bacterium]HSA00458.1 histidinol-phosphatase HisJ family protein [Candidatus Paceibacterota bacterium]